MITTTSTRLPVLSNYEARADDGQVAFGFGRCDAKLIDWLDELTAACPTKIART
jgi:hypothetical protein